MIIIVIIYLLGGFSGRFGGYGYGMGHSGMGLGGVHSGHIARPCCCSQALSQIKVLKYKDLSKLLTRGRLDSSSGS